MESLELRDKREMQATNYSLIFDNTIKQLQKDGKVPRLMLHSCCAPCSSYTLELLSEYFFVTVFYYNPNIYPDEEFVHRANEQQRFIELFPAKNKIEFIKGEFEKDRFYELAKGLEDAPERGERCLRCYELRLRETAKLAKSLGFDYFTTTLSISPQKSSQCLNEIGAKIASEEGIDYLFSDFKKKNGYLRSCEISKEYGMYRQDYCGCVFSYQERQRQIKENK